MFLCVEMQVVAMLKAKVSVTKFEPRCTLTEQDFRVPSDFKAGEILPLVLFE